MLAEAGRFATEEVAPLYRAGDRQGAVLADAAVTTPPGWKALYRRWIEAGWNGLSAPVEKGGQGLPVMLGMAAANRDVPIPTSCPLDQHRARIRQAAAARSSAGCHGL